MRRRGETKAAVLLRNNHRKEALGLEEVPGFLRQVAMLPGDLPFVEHGAEFLDRPIEESLLFGGQLGRRKRQQLRPVRIAGKKVRIPPHVAGLNGLTFRGRKAWQDFLGPAENVSGDIVPAKTSHCSPANARSWNESVGAKFPAALAAADSTAPVTDSGTKPPAATVKISGLPLSRLYPGRTTPAAGLAAACRPHRWRHR